MKMALEIWNRIIFNLHRATFKKNRADWNQERR